MTLGQQVVHLHSYTSFPSWTHAQDFARRHRLRTLCRMWRVHRAISLNYRQGKKGHHPGPPCDYTRSVNETRFLFPDTTHTHTLLGRESSMPCDLKYVSSCDQYQSLAPNPPIRNAI